MSNSLSGLDIPTSESSGLFMKKLEQGENRMRILTTPIQGYVHWPEGSNKPERYHGPTEIPTGVKDAKYFWFLTIAINGTGLAGLLADEKVSSADYQNVKALVNGEVNTFAGFNVVVLEDRTEGGLTIASDVVSAYAYDKSAIGLAIGIDMKTSIDYVPQKTSFLCNGMLKAGAAVRDASGLVEINYDATPA